MPAEKLSLESQKLLTYITYDWQPLDHVIELSLDGVPPGKALRNWQRRARAKVTARAAQGLPTTAPPDERKQRELTEDEKIVSGAKDILRSSAYGHRDRQRVEIELIDGVRMIRLKAECCPECRRPFDRATVETPPVPSPKVRSKVVYPKFPQWQNKGLVEGSSG